MILVKQEQVWEYISEDKDDVVCYCLLKVQTLDRMHVHVESLFSLTLLIFGDVSRCNAWVLGKKTQRG